MVRREVKGGGCWGLCKSGEPPWCNLTEVLLCVGPGGPVDWEGVFLLLPAAPGALGCYGVKQASSKRRLPLLLLHSGFAFYRVCLCAVSPSHVQPSHVPDLVLSATSATVRSFSLQSHGSAGDVLVSLPAKAWCLHKFPVTRRCNVGLLSGSIALWAAWGLHVNGPSGKKVGSSALSLPHSAA